MKRRIFTLLRRKALARTATLLPTLTHRDDASLGESDVTSLGARLLT